LAGAIQGERRPSRISAANGDIERGDTRQLVEGVRVFVVVGPVVVEVTAVVGALWGRSSGSSSRGSRPRRHPRSSRLSSVDER